MASTPPPGGSRAAAQEPTPMSQAAEAIAAAEADTKHPIHPPQIPTSESTASPQQTQNTQDPPSFSDTIPAEPPPPYSAVLGSIAEDGGLGTQASVGDDGRVNICIDQKNRRLSQLLVPALRSQLDAVAREQALPQPYIPPSLGGDPSKEPPPPLNIVVMVVGSRGDVQPFVALGKVLKETYGHRIRLATHPTFKKFVEENGLEFFSIGGDPAELMAFMVKNPGLMPGFDTLRNGDVGKRRKGIAEIIEGCWKACIESGDGFGVNSEQRTEAWVNSPTNEPANSHGRPFVADAIISNPPSFAHIHCAEKLGVPLHMMFTMPWSPTQAFPHPLANITSTNADTSLTNYLTYALVDMLTWQGLGDIINRFRQHTLNLEVISAFSAPGMLHRMRVPHTYCWSPALIPQPKDWANFISISGFYFLSLASNYTPEPELAAFLEAGPPPVYIGFGSIVLDDPNGMTKLIFEAVKKAGVRALVSKGWGGFGADEMGIPEGVFMLGNVPHDWLFKHVSCVVHHGGAGTTSAGIACGRPTVVVPFFGDQPFWGSMVARAGAGPEPIPHKQLTSENLAEAIQHALKPSSLERARDLATKIGQEKGCDVGAQSFHQHLNVDEMRCSILPYRAAVWRVKRTDIRLSALAAVVLANEGFISFSDLKLYRSREFETDAGPWDPVTGVTGAVMGTVTTMMMGVADLPVDTLRALRIHPDSRPKKTPARSNSEAASETASSSTDNRGPPTPGSSASGATTPVQSDSPHVSVKEDYSELHERANTSLSGSTKAGSSSGHGKKPSLGHVHSHSSSRSGASGPQEDAQQKPANDPNRPPFSIESALQSGKGVGRMFNAGMKAPLDVMMGLQRGFHNTSRLYGEEPRQVEKVTGLTSGLKVAGKEFGVGLAEGISGIITQPLQGARKDGAGGFLKGIGKGIAGIALKPQAAAFAIPAYTMKGIYMEVKKPYGATVQNYIIAARTAQGWEEYNKSSAEERALIVEVYRYIATNVKKKRNPGEAEMDAIHTLVQKRRAKANEQRQGMQSFLGWQPHQPTSPPPAQQQQQPQQPAPVRSPTSQHSSFSPGWRPHNDDISDEALQAAYHHKADEDDLEEAIRLSLAEASRGNPQEDALMERAMRNSLAQMERNPVINERCTAEEEAGILQRVLEQSRQEAEAMLRSGGEGAPSDHQSVGVVGGSGIATGDVDELEEALRRSRLDTRMAVSGAADGGGGWETDSPASPPTVGEVDGGSVRSTILGEVDTPGASSRPTTYTPAATTATSADSTGGHQQQGGEDDDEELKRAMEMSEREGRERAEEEEKARREEEIVMEYVKKQSLAEEEHRKRVGGGA